MVVASAQAIQAAATGFTVEIVALVVSPVHAYEGRPADGPRPDPTSVAREWIEVRAGLGVVGDRYFGHAAHRRAAVTMFAAEALDGVAATLGTGPLDPLLLRRNVVLRGVDVDALAATRNADGAVFSLESSGRGSGYGDSGDGDSGGGPVRFGAHRPASPCRWMDVVLGHGAWTAMRGRGGVRCEPLDDGVLRLGPAVLRVLVPRAPAATPPEAAAVNATAAQARGAAGSGP